MRTISLSDAEVISLITKYFVASWHSRDRYQVANPSVAEQAEVLRLDRERAKKRLPGGGVSVIIVASNGAVLTSQRVQDASDPTKLTRLLNDVIEKQKIKPREKPETKETPKREGGEFEEGSVVLHVYAVYEGIRRKNGLSEDRVELKSDEWKALLPDKDAKAGSTFDVPEKIAHRLFRHFYPPTPNWRVNDGKVLEGALRGGLAKKSDSDWRLVFKGAFKMSRPFGGKNTPGTVTGLVDGVAHYDPKEEKITSLHFALDRATFAWKWQDNETSDAFSVGVELEER